MTAAAADAPETKDSNDLVAKLTAMVEQMVHQDRLRTRVLEQLVGVLEGYYRRMGDLQDSLRFAQRTIDRFNHTYVGLPSPKAGSPVKSAGAAGQCVECYRMQRCATSSCEIFTSLSLSFALFLPDMS